MDPPPPESVCAEIADELCELATWLAKGKMNPRQFSLAVLELEAAKVTRHGFTLTARNSSRGKVEFALRFADSKKLCVLLECDPETGKIVAHNVLGRD